jgi:hypothetical protein
MIEQTKPTEDVEIKVMTIQEYRDLSPVELERIDKEFMVVAAEKESAIKKLEKEMHKIKLAKGERLKFIFIISPEIDKYLEWVSNERRMHKSQIVREAIENQANKDKEYQEFLRDEARY